MWSHAAWVSVYLPDNVLGELLGHESAQDSHGLMSPMLSGLCLSFCRTGTRSR